MRGFEKVRGEWSGMALCHNFSRMLPIIGCGGRMAALARRTDKPIATPIVAAITVYRRISGRGAAVWRLSYERIRVAPLGLGSLQ